MITFNDAPAQGYNDYSGLRQANFSQTAASFSFGTLTQMDTLQALRINQGTVLEYGIDRLNEQFQVLMDAANQLLAMQVQDLCMITTERFIRNGESASFVMEDLDEAGIPSAQKVLVKGSAQGFPLKRVGVGLQWNSEYFRQMEVRQFANNIQALLTADSNRIALEIRRALFTPTNYAYVDKLEDSARLPILALTNGDSRPINPNPYGVSFDAVNHTHYMYCGSGNGDTVVPITDAGNATWSGSTAAQKGQNLAAAVQNLKEHYITGTPKIYIDTTAAPYFQVANGAATQIPNFVRYDYIYVNPPTTRENVPGVAYNSQDVYNRPIGLYDGCEVWVKPWMPANYFLVFMVDQPKPLALRVPKGKRVGMTEGGSYSLGNGDLRLVQNYSMYPLYAEAMVRDFGVAAWERTNAVVFRTNSTSAYAAPTFP